MSAIFGETLSFGQRNGPDIQLKVTGDEYYAIHETLDGYTAVNDSDRGQFCYATVTNGSFVSSGVPVTDAAPAGLTNEGYGAEIRWSLADLQRAGVLLPGHNYRFYVMVHDGDQNKTGGDAGDSKFILVDPRRKEGAARDEVMRQNRDAFARMARPSLPVGNALRGVPRCA